MTNSSLLSSVSVMTEILRGLVSITEFSDSLCAEELNSQMVSSANSRRQKSVFRSEDPLPWQASPWPGGNDMSVQHGVLLATNTRLDRGAEGAQEASSKKKQSYRVVEISDLFLQFFEGLRPDVFAECEFLLLCRVSKQARTLWQNT